VVIEIRPLEGQREGSQRVLPGSDLGIGWAMAKMVEECAGQLARDLVSSGVFEELRCAAGVETHFRGGCTCRSVHSTDRRDTSLH